MAQIVCGDKRELARSRNNLCVLKLLNLDAMEQNYTNCTESRSALQYSCWVELHLMRIVQKLLLCRSTPCFPYLYTHFFLRHAAPCANAEQCLAEGSWLPATAVANTFLAAPTARLAICSEFLSHITLRQWLKHHIVDCRYFYNISNLVSSRHKRNYIHRHLRQQFQTLFLHIFVALFCMQEHDNWLHNDLHLDNIVMVQSGDQARDFVYKLGDKEYVVRNNLGESLQQLPVICDFGMASNDGCCAAGTTHFAQHYQATQFCTFHSTTDGYADSKNCRQSMFCDVARLLNDTYNQLTIYGKQSCAHADNENIAAQQMLIVMSAFAPYDMVRRHINACKRKSCESNEFENMQDLVETLFSPLAKKACANKRRATHNEKRVVFDCNNASKRKCK